MPVSKADDKKRELKQDHYYDAEGGLVESISYYLDERGRKVRHGDSIEYRFYARVTSHYVDGEVRSTSIDGKPRETTASSFTLTLAQPSHPETGISLLDIAADGTTRIRTTATQAILTAKPGGYFVSGEFGTQGLQLKSASAATRTAIFVLMNCGPGKVK